MLSDPKPKPIRFVKRTVSLHPFVDKILKTTWKEMIDAGWKNATYSLAINGTIMTFYFEHIHNCVMIDQQVLDETKAFFTTGQQTTHKDYDAVEAYAKDLLRRRKLKPP